MPLLCLSRAEERQEWRLKRIGRRGEEELGGREEEEERERRKEREIDTESEKEMEKEARKGKMLFVK